MAKESKTIERKILFQKIWQSPATTVCKEYGISSSMLARICAEMDVPRPPRGYWAKVQNGQKLKKPQLPKPNKETKLTRIIHAGYSSEHKKHIKKKKKREQVIADNPCDLTSLKKLAEHPFISATRKALKGSKPDSNGLISPERTYQHFRLSVSENQLERALSIASMALYLCERQGFKAVSEVTKNPSKNLDRYDRWNLPVGDVNLIWAGEKNPKHNEVSISIRELRNRYMKLDDESSYRYDSYSYKPSGLLILKVHNFEIKDKKILKIEDEITGVAIRLLEKCKEEQDRRAEWKRREDYNEMIRSFKSDWNRQKEREEKAFNKILKQASKFEEATSLRSYLANCELRLQNTLCSEKERRDYELKLDFIKAKLLDLDPFTSSDIPWDIIPIHTATGSPPPNPWD